MMRDNNKGKKEGKKKKKNIQDLHGSEVVNVEGDHKFPLMW